MEEIIKKEQYDGCSLLTSRRNTWWYVCSKKENSHKPTFYNYNKFRKAPHSKVMKVVSFSSKEMTFEDRSTEDLKFSPFYWMGKFGGGTLTPETECSFKEIGTGNQVTYTLNCKNHDVQTGIQLEKIKSQ